MEREDLEDRHHEAARGSDFWSVVQRVLHVSDRLGRRRPVPQQQRHRVPLAETRNGKAGAPSTLPTLKGGTGVIINGVSCVAAKSCVAVGEYFTPTGADPLAESWNGSKWTTAKPPMPGQLVGDLNGVSCRSAKSCVRQDSVGGPRIDGWSAS